VVVVEGDFIIKQCNVLLVEMMDDVVDFVLCDNYE